ncbi:MAG TPA: hypothetical protein PL033_07955 [Candidatus Brocadiia bacterium]|nr:hypothetical protein [Candidatus Brocadiia bacterium]
MKRISGDDLNRVEYRGGGGAAIAIGLVCVSIGCLAGVSMLKQGEYGGAAGVQFFTLVGIGLCFGRSGLILDKASGSYEKWYGIFTLVRRSTGKLDVLQHIALTREVRRSKNNTYTVYPVRIRGNYSINIGIMEGQDQRASRREAEFLAKALGIRMEDSTTGTVVVREGAEVDESLRERRRKSGEARQPLPEAPPDMRCRMSVEGASVRIEIPPAGLGAAAIPLAFGVILLCLALGALMFGRALGLPWQVVATAGAVGVMALIGVAWGTLQAMRGVTVVIVSRDELRIEKQSSFGGSSEALPADEIEELIVGRADGAPRPSILARSDAKTLSFGAGLPESEMEWIRRVIETTIG